MPSKNSDGLVVASESGQEAAQKELVLGVGWLSPDDLARP